MEERYRKMRQLQRDIQPDQGFGIFSEFATEFVFPAVAFVFGLVCTLMIIF